MQAHLERESIEYKIIKKRAFLICLIALSFGAKAQVSIGVHAIALLSKGYYNAGENYFLKSKSIFGWKAGVTAAFSLNKNLYLEPEFNIVSKGWKNSGPGLTGVTYVLTISPQFLEIPLNLAYIKTLNRNNKFFVGAGPVPSLGISGKSKVVTTIRILRSPDVVNTNSSDIKFDGKRNMTDNRTHLKQLEIGGNVFVGYKLNNRLCIKAMYFAGFTNLSVRDNVIARTNYAGIELCYFFARKSK